MKGERPIEEFIGQTGGKEMSTTDEVRAMRELSERLGMSTPKIERPTAAESAERQRMETSDETNSLSDSERERRLDQAAELGRDPGLHFKSEEMQLQHRIGKLQEDQQRVLEGRRDAMIIAPQGDKAFEKREKEEARKAAGRVLGIQEEIDRLEGMRQKFNKINQALTSGDIRPAREELEVEIDTVEASIMQLDRTLSLARSGEVKGDMVSYEEQKRKLEEKRDRSRRMVGNLNLYKK